MTVAIENVTDSYVDLKITLEDGYELPTYIQIKTDHSVQYINYYLSGTNPYCKFQDFVYNAAEGRLRIYSSASYKWNTDNEFKNFLRGGNTTLKVVADATPVEAEAEAVSIPASEPELAANPEPALNVTLVKTLEGMTVELGTVTADYVQLVLAAEEGYTLPDALTMEVLGVGIYTIYTTTENIEATPDGVDCNVENNTITLYADFLKVSSGTLNITGFATADASA